MTKEFILFWEIRTTGWFWWKEQHLTPYLVSASAIISIRQNQNNPDESIVATQDYDKVVSGSVLEHSKKIPELHII